MHKTYDYIICGIGLSGSTLALLLTQSKKLKTKRILLIEQTAQPAHNHISFWSIKKPVRSTVIKKSWRKISANIGKAAKHALKLNRYQFFAFFSDEYIGSIVSKLKKIPTVRYLKGKVVAIHPKVDGAEVTLENGDMYCARYVFDSTNLGTNHQQPSLYKGLVFIVETKVAVFDEESITLFDFQSTEDSQHFLYIVPESNKKAVVQIASLSTLPSENACKKWITNFVGTEKYSCIQIVAENKTVPTNFVQNERVIPIGIKAKLLRKASGYAYTNIVRQAKQIVASLENNEVFTKKNKFSNLLYVLLDSAFLTIMNRFPNKSNYLLEKIFSNATGDDILDFLDNKASLSQIMKMPFKNSS